MYAFAFESLEVLPTAERRFAYTAAYTVAYQAAYTEPAM